MHVVRRRHFITRAGPHITALDDEVLADDAVWEVVQHSPTGGTIEDTVSGRADIVAWFEQIMGGEVSMSEGTVRHFLNTHVITVDGDRAHSTSHLQAVGTDSMAILSVGFAEADHVRTARAPGPRHQHLQALQAVARGVVAPDELNQIFGPHRTAVPDRERSKQRLRAVARNRSPPPAHIGQQGEGDAHVTSLGARPLLPGDTTGGLAFPVRSCDPEVP